MDRDEPSNDSSATPAEIYEASRPPFFQFLVDTLVAVPPNCRLILLTLLAKVMMDEATWGTNITAACGASNDTPKEALNFREAFVEFIGHITRMSMFIMIYVSAQTLTWVHSQPLAGALVLLAPILFFLPLLAKAPNLSVICGTFKLSISCFVFLCALSFFLLMGSVVLLVLFIYWKKLMRCARIEAPTIPSNTGNEAPTIPSNTGDSNDTPNDEEMEETQQDSPSDRFEIEVQVNPVQPNEVF